VHGAAFILTGLSATLVSPGGQPGSELACAIVFEFAPLAQPDVGASALGKPANRSSKVRDCSMTTMRWVTGHSVPEGRIGRCLVEEFCGAVGAPIGGCPPAHPLKTNANAKVLDA
jgi:hypothetical protein